MDAKIVLSLEKRTKMRQSLSEHFSAIFPGKVRKIALNAGLSCPNRDGKLGTGGCIFCNNLAFNPRYASQGGSITRQLEEGISFASIKGESWGYLAYFQSYSNTYADTQKLISLYEEALSYPEVVGLVIGTRPDCLQEDLLDYFEHRFGSAAPKQHPYLLVEIGVESTIDETLREINRGHDFETCKKAISALAERGIEVGAHLILGLPGEDDNDYILHAQRLSLLPLTSIKLHHLQVIKGTELERRYAADPNYIHTFSPEEYIQKVALFLSYLREDIVVDRLVSETPKDMVVAPGWGLKPAEFKALFESISEF